MALKVGTVLNLCITLEQLDLFGASSRTSPDTLPLATEKSDLNYKALATKLSREYLVRKRLAHHTRGKDSSSLPWSTPRVGGQEGYKTRLERGKDMGLQGQVEYYTEKNWPTPRNSEWKGTGPKGSKSQIHMNERDYLCARVEETDGQPDPEKNNTNGKRHELNPAWVLQLMGTTIEKTFFAWREMESLNKQHNSHG